MDKLEKELFQMREALGHIALAQECLGQITKHDGDIIILDDIVARLDYVIEKLADIYRRERRKGEKCEQKKIG